MRTGEIHREKLLISWRIMVVCRFDSYILLPITENGFTIENKIFPAAFLLTGMDQNVDPCEDFFEFACGMWNRIHVIPEDRSSITTFEVLADQLQHVLRRKFHFFFTFISFSKYIYVKIYVYPTQSLEAAFVSIKIYRFIRDWNAEVTKYP